MPLLTTSNPKVLKGEKQGYLTAILHLAPHKVSGRNVCPMATAGCAAACLNTAGRGHMISIQEARVRKTLSLFEDRDAFLRLLRLEIAAHVRKADRDGLVPCIRLNGTSDLRWERFKVDGAPNLMSLFPDVQFYDYTKIANRRDLPANYHLTFSLAEGARSWSHHLEALANGYSVAVVLSGAGSSRYPQPLPATWNGRTLVDGDTSDLRFLDPPAVYVGLRAKGRATSDTSGFVYPVYL